MKTWIALFAVGCGSYVMRAVPLFSSGLMNPSANVQRAIRHAGLATLTALVVTTLQHRGAGNPSELLAAATAVGVAGAVGLRSRHSMLLVVGVGLATYAILHSLVA